MHFLHVSSIALVGKTEQIRILRQSLLLKNDKKLLKLKGTKAKKLKTFSLEIKRFHEKEIDFTWRSGVV